MIKQIYNPSSSKMQYELADTLIRINKICNCYNYCILYERKFWRSKINNLEISHSTTLNDNCFCFSYTYSLFANI